MLSLFERDLTDVTAGFSVVIEIQDMSAIANGAAGGDVENLINTESVPNSIWELHEVGRRR